MASFCKNQKMTFSGSKKKSKTRKNFFFSIVQNYPKVTKKAKKSKFRPIYLDLERFFDQKNDPQNVQFRPFLTQKLPKMPNFQDFPTCRGSLGHDTNRKNLKSPKMGLTSEKLSYDMGSIGPVLRSLGSIYCSNVTF